MHVRNFLSELQSECDKNTGNINILYCNIMSSPSPSKSSEYLLGIQRTPSDSARRRKKRWSFNHSRANNIDLSAEGGGARERRLSDFHGVDAIHQEIDPYHVSPAQLYSTESGRLFHAGKICIVLCGLTGRGKTHLSVSLTRYLRWLGVKTHLFHLGDYRRAGAEDDLHHDLFKPAPGSAKAHEFRRKIVDDCIKDIVNFFKNDKGQIAIYDAVNALAEDRLELNKILTDNKIQVIFIEVSVTNDKIILKNMEEAARSSPDYANWPYEQAYRDYSERIRTLTPLYQQLGSQKGENVLSYIKFVNFGERIELFNSNYGYLINKVVFFLMNSRIKLGSVFFARCYKNTLDVKQDPDLDEDGKKYANNIAKTLVNYLEGVGRKSTLLGDKESSNADENAPRKATIQDGAEERSFVVWTSVKKRTIEAAQFFNEKGVKVRPRIQLSQKNPGIVANLTEEEIEKKYPEEYALYIKDPYHYRFSRAELYHDLAIKIEPLILEMERMSGDLLIIADETILKVFYGYLMACSCYDIPYLNFSTDEIIEIRFNAYSNTQRKIPIQDFSK